MNGYFSCGFLAHLTMPGYPTSRQGWDKYVKEAGWEYREIRGRGKGGIQREYLPPPHMQDLIEIRLRELYPNGYSVIDEARRKSNISTKAGEKSTAVKHSVREPVSPLYIGDDGKVAIDKYVNVSGSAGPGSEVYEEAVVKVRVDARLLRERIGGNFNKIKIAAVSGDSMEPTLSHGDQVLVDTSCNRFVENAIYAIQQDGFLRFKRITLKLDGSIIVKSDASTDVESYPAEVAARFFVVGMVIPFKFGRFKV